MSMCCAHESDRRNIDSTSIAVFKCGFENRHPWYDFFFLWIYYQRLPSRPHFNSLWFAFPLINTDPCRFSAFSAFFRWSAAHIHLNLAPPTPGRVHDTDFTENLNESYQRTTYLHRPDSTYSRAWGSFSPSPSLQPAAVTHQEIYGSLDSGKAMEQGTRIGWDTSHNQLTERPTDCTTHIS